MPVPVSWLIRRATLVDVPSVSRLIESPLPTEGEPDPAFTSATRLVLTHIGLESGEFWVATDEDGGIQAATVLLPPRHDAAGHDTPEAESVTMALKLHLGAVPTLPELDELAADPQAHWLLLAVAEVGAEPVLAELLAVALPVADAAGLPVLTVHPGRATQVLLEAGFRPHPPGGAVPAMMRAAVPSPLPALPDLALA